MVAYSSGIFSKIYIYFEFTGFPWIYFELCLNRFPCVMHHLLLTNIFPRNHDNHSQLDRRWLKLLQSRLLVNIARKIRQCVSGETFLNYFYFLNINKARSFSAAGSVLGIFILIIS